MNKEPLVSIIIPTYNRKHHLIRAINSCINQTYKNIEIIVIDDCSNYDVQTEIDKIKDYKIRFRRNITNSGAPHSRNRGIELSKGDYINFLDDDDTLLPEKIEKQIKKFKKENYDKLGIVTCDVRVNRHNIKKIIKNRKYGNFYREILKRHCVVAINSMLIKREVLQKIKFDTSFRCNQEYDLMIRMAKVWVFDYVPEVLCEVLDSTNHITSSFSKKFQCSFRIVNKYKYEYLKQGVVIYNLARFSYIFFKITMGAIFGQKVYNKLP